MLKGQRDYARGAMRLCSSPHEPTPLPKQYILCSTYCTILNRIRKE